jgi:glycosyltransferase involved in cell wall biosynthesis
VTTVHGFNSVNAYSRVMTFGDRVICVSGAIKEYIQTHYGVPDERTIVIPRGVDLALFDPARLDAGFMEEFRSRYALQGKFVVTSVGRITQLKDYETFINALVMVKKVIPDLVGLIVGGVHEDRKDYFSLLQLQIEAAVAGDFIKFTGSQSKVAEIYALTNVVVSSSKKPESFGRSAAEALAMGVPVVASGHGGILDIVRDGETGFLFPPGEAAMLAEKILAVRGKTFGNLRPFVVENFSLEQMVEKTVELYRCFSPPIGKERRRIVE